MHPYARESSCFNAAFFEWCAMKETVSRLATLEEAERAACGLYQRLSKPGAYLDKAVLLKAKRLYEEAKEALKRYFLRRP